MPALKLKLEVVAISWDGLIIDGIVSLTGQDVLLLVKLLASTPSVILSVSVVVEDSGLVDIRFLLLILAAEETGGVFVLGGLLV